MKLQFLGGARTVTGTMHLIHANGHNILLDCGLFQGKRKEFFERNKNFPFEPRGLDVLVLSHAHIDHSGNIPNLVKAGFSGNIFCTHATRALCSIMLRDSGYIQEKDAEYVNKKRAKKKEEPIEPLYTIQDAEDCMDNFVAIGYNRSFLISDGVELTFYDAGHILGSAITVLDIQESGKKWRLVFTGDLGRKNTPILKDPHLLNEADILLTESTYGGTNHDDLRTVNDKLAQVINETYNLGGKIIIPAFSVGRTQEIIYSLHDLRLADQIPELPVFVDSPLAVNATEIFRLHTECYDKETKNHFLEDRDPFGFDRLKYVRDVEESKQINTLREPCIVISASGMCEAGRILHHLKNNIEDANNTVLVVGFMAENTLGRRIVERQEIVRIFGEEYYLRARVAKLNAFSAHAGHNELLDYISHFNKRYLKQVFVVHGEFGRSEALANGVSSLGFSGIRIPKGGDVYTIT